ncbi:FxSxx-COOH system tetratricopeptide repeat protein, partial [Actinacidiphila bryophytorum]
EFLRELVRGSGRSLESLTGPLGVSTTTIGVYLGGKVPRERFVTSLVAATSGRHADRVRALSLLRAALSPAPVRPPEQSAPAQVAELQGQLIEAYQRLTRAQDQRDELREAADNYGRLVMVLWTMVHFLRRRVDGLTREREELRNRAADSPWLEQSARELARAQGQESRAVARLDGAQEMRRRAEDMLARVIDQVGRLSQELEELRAGAGLGPGEVRDPERPPVPVEVAPVTEDIDRALNRADEISAESARTLERIGRELDAPVGAETAPAVPAVSAVPAREQIAVVHAAEDTLWAEWVGWLLTAAGFDVLSRQLGGTPDPYGPQPAVLVWSAATQRHRAAAPTYVPRLVVLQVAGASPVRWGASAVNLATLGETAASEAVHQALGLEPPEQLPQPGRGGRRPAFPGDLPRIFNLPSRNAEFTGRAGQLAELRERLRPQLFPDDQPSYEPPRYTTMPQAVCGLSGVGKTQLALEYAHRFAAEYAVVWWISAEQSESIAASLAELAFRLGESPEETQNLAEAAQSALDALRREPQGRWLVVLDNADDPDAVMPYLPSGPGDVLVTSRNRTWNLRTGVLELDVFTVEEAVDHLLRRLPGVGREDASELAAEVGHIPLAVELAASWLYETATPVGTYIEQLREQTVLALSAVTPADSPVAFGAPWQVAFMRLLRDMPAAARLLQLCSLMSAEPVSVQLLYGDRMVEALLPYDERLRDRLMMGQVLQSLRRYGLAVFDSAKGTVQVHRLVQAVVRNDMGDQELEDVRHTVHRVLAGARPAFGGTDDRANWPLYARVWPHLGASGAAACPDPETRELFIDRVHYLWQRGELSMAEQLARELTRRWEELFGERDRQLLRLRSQLAAVLRSQGRFTECLPLDEDVLARMREELGEDHPQTLRTAGAVAADLRVLGRFREALELVVDARARMQEMMGEDHPDALALSHSHAVDLHIAGSYQAARRLNEEVARSSTTVLGQWHPQTFDALAALGADLRALGEYAESVALLRDLAEAPEEDPQGPAALARATSLALSLRRAGQDEEARELLRQTHTAYRERYDDALPGALACALALASARADAGETEAALELGRAVHERVTASLGADHPSALVCAHNLAVHLRQGGQALQAVELSRTAAEGLRAALGEHPYAMIAQVTLANATAEAGDPGAAVPLTRESLDWLSWRLSPEHPDVMVVSADLAVAVREAGVFGEAMVLRDDAVADLARVLPDGHRWLSAARAGRRIDRDLEMFPQ